jgi:MFS family permease
MSETDRLLSSSSTANILRPKNDTPASSIYLIVLIAICFVSINNYFCYHEPSAIALQFEEYYNINTKQFGTLFTIYSAPNVILVFFSGQFIDSYGLRKSSLLFNSLILVSMIIAAITPPPSGSFWTPTVVYICLLFSRLLLGLGGESICACVSTMISRWFSSTAHLNTAMALNQASVQVFGSAAAFYILPHAGSITLCQWITVGVCVISLVANLIYNHYETIYDAYLDEINVQKDVKQHVEYLDEKHHQENAYQYQTVSVDIEQTTPTTTSTTAPTTPSSFSFTNTLANISTGLAESWYVLTRFPTLFWLLLIHIGLVSPILYTFTAFGPMYLQETFPSTATATEAGNAISLLYMSIVAAPFTGIVIDWIGYRAQIQFFASCNIPILFFLLTYDLLNPNVCMIWMGIIFSITESNGMALVSLVVPMELTGTAYGIYACCISIALLVEPAAVGWIREQTGSFAWSIWIFFGLTFVGSVAAAVVALYDKYHDQVITKSAKESNVKE